MQEGLYASLLLVADQNILVLDIIVESLNASCQALKDAE